MFGICASHEGKKRAKRQFGGALKQGRGDWEECN